MASHCKLKSMITESLSQLKVLLNCTNDAIGILKSRNRPVDHWDDWLMYIIVQRLDPQTRQDWENFLGATTNSPNFEMLKLFLSTRIRTLESLENCLVIPDISSRINKPNNQEKPNKSVKVHSSTNCVQKS